MCTPKDVLDPSVDGQISYLCGRHDCSLLHFGDPVIGTVYDDRILVSSGQWWPLPRVYSPAEGPPGVPTEAPLPEKGQGRLCWAASPCLGSSWGESAGAGWASASCSTGWSPRSTVGSRRSVAWWPRGWPSWPLGSS